MMEKVFLLILFSTRTFLFILLLALLVSIHPSLSSTKITKNFVPILFFRVGNHNQKEQQKAEFSTFFQKPVKPKFQRIIKISF